MPRIIKVAAAQLGPIALAETRSSAVKRMITLMQNAKAQDAELVVFTELALTTFFPRWYFEEQSQIDKFFETEMPNKQIQPLFDEARKLKIGFNFGFAELVEEDGVTRHFNTAVIVNDRGEIAAKYRKIHLPGHIENETWRAFQHLEKRYFEKGNLGFQVHQLFSGKIGMCICNDRRWPETYRVMALQNAEMILIGYNTPMHYAPDPSQNPLQSFHNQLVMQAGAYQNGTWVVGVAKGGIEEGVDSLAESVIIAPSGEIVAQATTTDDELVVADCDLDWCKHYKNTLFDFDRYRRPEMYELITRPKTDQ